MNEQPNQTEQGIFDNHTETQKEILAIEIRRTRNKLFTLAVVAFAGDFLGLLAANILNLQTLLIISVIPLLLVGLAFLALKEPLTAMIIAAIIFSGGMDLYNCCYRRSGSHNRLVDKSRNRLFTNSRLSKRKRSLAGEKRIESITFIFSL